MSRLQDKLVIVTGAASGLGRATAKLFAEAGARLVCALSISGLIAQGCQAGYNASKFGVIGLAKCMTLDVVADNILVNAVCPGMMDTVLLAHMAADE